MSVYINGTILPVQPAALTEELLQIQTDQMSINGSMTRNRIGQKKQATMEFPILQPSDYQTMVNYFTTGSGVYYSNDQSNYTGNVLAMSGLPSFVEDQYVAGSSLYRPFKVVIREI
jgi:hypothetical protein